MYSMSIYPINRTIHIITRNIHRKGFKGKNSMQIGYYAVFNYDEYDPKEERYGISILFPDVPECNSCARSEGEGLAMAKEVLELVTAFYKVHELPKVSRLEEIDLSKNEKTFFISYFTEELDMNQFTIFENQSDKASPYTFTHLISDLQTGREIEFIYNNISCAITNSEGQWWLTQGQDSEALCAFEDKDELVRNLENRMVFGVSVKDIFNEMLYLPESLYIL